MNSTSTPDYDMMVVLSSEAGPSPSLIIPESAEDLSVVGSEISLKSSSDAARALLIQERIAEPRYRPPETRTLYRFKTKERKEALREEDKWVFTKHEVAKAFNNLLSNAVLPPPGIAQALLSHVFPSSLEELWEHLHDPKLEKRMNRRFGRRSSSTIIPSITWLDGIIAQGNNPAYVRLLCQTRVGQETLDRAFSIALSKYSMDVMEVLLRFGAVASACQEAIRGRVRLGDVDLIKLLLTAPAAMSVEAWQVCMEPEVESCGANGSTSLAILPLCLAHRPEVASSSLLLAALGSQNLQATTILLSHAGTYKDAVDLRHQACELASRVEDDELRHNFFQLLAKSGFVTDSLTSRAELMKDVKIRHLSLVRLLADAGVTLDTEPYNALYWSVAQMDLEILELFKNGEYSSPVSLVLYSVPTSASEPDMLRLLEILGPMGLSGEPLHCQLIRAVQQQQIQLVSALLRYGASIEFDQASTVRIALEEANFEILTILLRNECSPKTLSANIPTAMRLRPRLIRLQAFRALAKKGLVSEELGVPLRELVSEDKPVDYDLIQLLLEHGAPVDTAGSDHDNPILVSTRRGDLSVLRMLCGARTRKETLSTAVLVAFESNPTCGYDVARDMMRLLLQKGAAGQPIWKTLLAAVKHDHHPDIVQLLIEHGADANYSKGAAFAAAIKRTNFEMLSILCIGCAPTRATTEAVLPIAVDARHFNLQMLELLLDSTPFAAAALNNSWVPARFRGHPNVIEIVSCFLQRGMDVNLKNGNLLCFAIQEGDVALLEKILFANPDLTSLKAGYQEGIKTKTRNIEYEITKLLLEKAGSAEIGQSESLLVQTHAALAGDLRGLCLLLRHKAVVDIDDGKAVRLAAAAGSLQVLDMLLSSMPALSTLNSACLAAASSTISPTQKQSIFDRLLATDDGVLAADISNLLADSVTSLPECTQLPHLLLARGAQAKIETLQIALRTSSRDLFYALANSVQSQNTIAQIFNHVRSIAIDSGRRYWILEYLLSRGIIKEDISEALIDSLKSDDHGDLSIPKLLLEHGAEVAYNNCAAFGLALRLNSSKAVKLLSQYLIDDRMAGVAFDLARKTASLDTQARFEVYRCLLQWNIHNSSIYKALIENLRGGHPDTTVVRLLLANGADPNKNKAQCFVVASRTGAEAEFRALSKYAKLPVVSSALMNHFQEEWEVVWWFGVCLEEQRKRAKIDQDDLLFQCMRKFPLGSALLNLLLENGLSASAMMTYRLYPDWAPELCTALIWALYSQPRIENDAILVLLARGGDGAHPAYLTPVTKVSAASACLVDKSRAPVLEALLKLDRDRILSQKMLGSTIGYLAAYPEKFDEESSLLGPSSELSLRDASIYLGNFDAFRPLSRGETTEEGMLHLAAMLALPKFVKHLLKVHDANLPGEDYQSLIPLALVCRALPLSECKIANEEAPLITRQKQTMQLLAPHTNLSWRYLNKSVLHYAVDQGLEVTKAMVEALDLRRDPEKNERHLHVDMDGIHYSPDQYVVRILNPDFKEARALVECLKECGLQSRYYRAVEPGPGVQQPVGYQGLPPRLDRLWKAHVKSLVPPEGTEDDEAIYPSDSISSR